MLLSQEYHGLLIQYDLTPQASMRRNHKRFMQAELEAMSST